MVDSMYQNETWKTKEGRTIKIRDLEDSHLVNIIRFIRVRAGSFKEALISEAYSFASMLHGDMAQFAADQDINSMYEEPAEDLIEETPLFQALIKEAKKRKLKVEAWIWK